jgi:diguanylate cyclase (GGDEF)-like protein/PAS domain S-box-containing protein
MNYIHFGVKLLSIPIDYRPILEFSGQAMFAVYFCIQNEHDLRLVALAGLICIAASMAAVILLRQARDARGKDRARWLGAAGSASGFGIWATHFIAMMGYDPGVVMGYSLVPTIVSLLVAIGAVTGGFWIALRGSHVKFRVAAGVAVGTGIAAMHYTGMQAVEFPGTFAWSYGYVAASIILAILPIVPALSLALDRDDMRSGLGAGLSIVLAILMLHFTGMAGITILPNLADASQATLLSPLAMGIAVGGTAFAVLTLGMLIALMSGRARQAIEASEREFRIIVQGISDCALYMLDGDGRVASWNAGARRLKGYAADEAIGLHLASFHSREEQATGLPERSLETARETGKFNGEGWRYRKDGTRFWAHVTIEAVHDDRGIFHGFAKITRDMTQFKQDQERLETLTGNLDTALSNMLQGLCLFGADERLILCNDRVLDIFGISREQCREGTAFTDLIRHTLEKRAAGPIPAELLNESLERQRACIAQPGGGTLIVPFTEHCALSISHRPMPGGGWVSTIDDITDRRRAEQRIEHMALHDGLTGLPNRSHYIERLESEIDAARRRGTKVAVIGVDLDRFKEVNDAHGHATGDTVLRMLAERMRSATAGSELVARFGGDEFAAFKPFDDDAELEDFVARLESCLSRALELDELTIVPGASIGIALFPADGVTREQVVNNADLAMYRAKATVGRHICYYEQGMDEAARARRMLANDLREAIPRQELSMAYQVQRSVTSGEVTGYEALLRWHHPRDGWISPTEFIPIAEESGEILRIGEWALRTACNDAARWSEPWRLAVNLSPIQLMHVDLITIVRSALVSSGLPAHRLELEITETAFVADKVRALHVLRQIKAMGVTIAIDDFGTGYSSLDTLNSFPFDKIKIDKSFLIESENSHQAQAIIRAVLALGRSLQVPVLAEGLESEDQLRLLKSEGCDEAQGYYWGRPMPHPLPRQEQPSSPVTRDAA